MTRRILSLLLALMLCMSMAVCVSAEPKAIDFVIDEFGNLSDDELMELNELAAEIYETTGVGVFFVYVYTDSVEDYDLEWITCGIADYVVMMENDAYWCLHRGGLGMNIDDATKYELRDIYDAAPTYVEGVEWFLTAAAECFPDAGEMATEEAVTEPEAEPTEETAIEPENKPTGEVPENETADTTTIGAAADTFLIDEADLLTDTEEVALRQKLEDVSHTYNTQLVIATLSSLDGKDIDVYVEYLYDSMGFGYGETKEGVLLLISMGSRQYRILSNGHAGVAIGPDQIDTLCDFMDLYLPNGHYVAAFNSFADQCGEMLEYYRAGSPFKAGKSFVISLVIGIAAGLIVAFVLKSQLKSVRKQARAHDYVKPDSMHLEISRDIFLYRTVTKTEKRSSSDDSVSRSRSSGGSARSRDGATARSKGGGSF